MKTKPTTLRDELEKLHISAIEPYTHANNDNSIDQAEQAIKELIKSKLDKQGEYSRAISGIPDDKITIAFANELMASAYLGCIEDIKEVIEGL